MTRMSQEQIVLTLVQGSEVEAWAQALEGWSPNAKYPVCYWEGINCDNEHRETVVGIILPNRGFDGTLPSELGLLSSLSEIDMPANQVRGTIPVEIPELPALEIINLSNNQISRTIPLFKSPLLEFIDLGNNQLTGKIPSEIGEWCRQLTDFDVQGNKITGRIPHSFSEVNSLNALSLSKNSLSGTIPHTLGNIKQLKYLYLDQNNLMGTLPPQLAMLSDLRKLWLEHNMLSGTVPAAYADLEKLTNFYIDGNKFTGTIPQDLCREEINKDFFKGFDDDVERDFCDSIACPIGHVSVDGLFPCDRCHDKYFNPYLGRVEECIDYNQGDILMIFHDATWNEKDAYWNGKDGHWNERNDGYCEYTGVTCDKNQNVIKLSLSGMGLQGTIPDELGFLRHLRELDLRDNNLTGFLPSDLRFAPLTKLDITGNQLKGIVPELLCEKVGLNGNGDNGEFGCRNIACPVGFFSSSGMGSFKEDEDCIPCPESLFLGRRSCNISLSTRSTGPHTARLFRSIGIFVVVCLVLVGILGKIRRRMRRVDHYIDWELALCDDDSFTL